MQKYLLDHNHTVQRVTVLFRADMMLLHSLKTAAEPQDSRFLNHTAP